MWGEYFSRQLANVFFAIDWLLAVPANVLGLSSNGILRGLIAVFVVIGLIAATLLNLTETGAGVPLGTSFKALLLNPLTGLIVAWTVVLLLISVNRSWSQNEQLRGRIAEGEVREDPDNLPDLRFLAFVSAALVTGLLPAVLLLSNRYSCAQGAQGCLFIVHGQGVGPWARLSGDLFLRVVGFFGVPDVYGLPSPTEIQPRSLTALHLIMFARLVIGFVVLATIFELYRISSTLGRAARALSEGPEPAIRLGSRAINSLLVYLRETTSLNDDPRIVAVEDPNRVARNASIALGRIGNTRALPTLKQTVEKPSIHDRVRKRALDAINEIATKLIARRDFGWWFERQMVRRGLRSLAMWSKTQLEAEEKRRGNSAGVVIEGLSALSDLLDGRAPLVRLPSASAAPSPLPMDDMKVAA